MTVEFYKQTWEKQKSDLPISLEMIYELITPLFPKSKIDAFELVSSGLANTNIKVRTPPQSGGLDGLEQPKGLPVLNVNHKIQNLPASSAPLASSCS